MKKFMFAVFFVITILFSTTTVLAADTLTLERLTAISSWEELVNEVDNIDIVANDEEWYCIWILNGIRHSQIIPILHNQPYISKSYGGIKKQKLIPNKR